MNYWYYYLGENIITHFELLLTLKIFISYHIGSIINSVDECISFTKWRGYPYTNKNATSEFDNIIVENCIWNYDKPDLKNILVASYIDICRRNY